MDKPFGFLVREAGVADLEEMLRLERATDRVPHWPGEAYRGLLAGGTGDGSLQRRALVAVVPGPEAAESRTIGFAVGRVLGLGAGLPAEIESLAVAEDWRRRGVARALCVELLGWMATFGVREVGLEVRAASGDAVALYEGLGFQDAGVRPGYYRDPPDDARLMRLVLGSA